MREHPDEAAEIVARQYNIEPAVARSAVRNLTTSMTKGVPYWGEGEIHLEGLKRIPHVRAYVWGGRLHGWREVRTTGALSWTPSALGDGTYLVTVCYKDAGRPLPPVIPPARQRPGPAEATVSRPPWRLSGCLARPRVVRVERLAAYVDSTGSFEPGSRPPLMVSADRGQATVELEQDCSGRRFPDTRGLEGTEPPE